MRGRFRHQNTIDQPDPGDVDRFDGGVGNESGWYHVGFIAFFTFMLLTQAFTSLLSMLAFVERRRHQIKGGDDTGIGTYGQQRRLENEA